MKNIAYSLFVLVIALSACNKDQKVNDKLDGSWRVVSLNDSEEGFGFFNSDSIVGIDEIQSMEFFSCKQKDGACGGTVTGNISDTVVNQIIGFSYDFTFTNTKDKLDMEFAITKETKQTASWNITELKKGMLTLESEGNKLILEQTFDR